MFEHPARVATKFSTPGGGDWKFTGRFAEGGLSSDVLGTNPLLPLRSIRSAATVSFAIEARFNIRENQLPIFCVRDMKALVHHQIFVQVLPSA